MTSISLTAGDWDVDGNGYIAFSASGTVCEAGISTTNNAMPAATSYLGTNIINATSIGGAVMPTGSVRVSLASTTTVYLVCMASFSTGTANAQGSIQARRVR